MKKFTFCCLFGGKSSEYEVSLSSAYGVITNTDNDKYEIIKVGITRGGDWFRYDGLNENIKNGSWCADSENLRRAFFTPGSNLCCVGSDGVCEYTHIDVAFPVMHGAFSEDGRMQGLLEMYSVRFVGPGCASSAVCMDKAFTKQILKNYNIPQAKTVVVSSEEVPLLTNEAGEALEKVLGFPLFVKPANAGSSVGASKVSCINELSAALAKAAAQDSKILIEEYIKGREIEVAVMGNSDAVASVCGEIDPGAEFYDYETKYVTDTASYYITARISDESSEKVRSYAVEIFKALGCRGLARVDFFVKENGDVIFNEINTLPGFTPISMYPKLFIYGGMTYPQIVDKLLTLAMEK